MASAFKKIKELFIHENIAELLHTSLSLVLRVTFSVFVKYCFPSRNPRVQGDSDFFAA